MKVNPRIVVASVLGILLVGGSYLLSKMTAEEADTSIASLRPASETREFIPVTDEDQDGLPDWQNALVTGEIIIDEEPEAGTMTKTASLAVELATLTSGGNVNIPSITTQLGGDLSRSALDKEYTEADIRIGKDDSAFSLRAYGNAVAAIALENAPPRGTEDELTVLNRALLRDDVTLLAGLEPTILSYEQMVADMLLLEVPPSLTREHLALLNVYQALLNDIKAFKATFDDALPAMLRFRRYQADVEALLVAINMLYLKLDAAGIKWTSADTASKFIIIE